MVGRGINILNHTINRVRRRNHQLCRISGDRMEAVDRRCIAEGRTIHRIDQVFVFLRLPDQITGSLLQSVENTRVSFAGPMANIHLTEQKIRGAAEVWQDVDNDKPRQSRRWRQIFAQ